VVDADGHFIETIPVFRTFFLDYVKDIGGGDLAARFEAAGGIDFDDMVLRPWSALSGGAQARALGHAPVVVEPARREHARPRDRASAAPALRTARRVRDRLRGALPEPRARRRSRSSTPSCARWRAAR
jgi:hypothetical protein